MSRRLLADAARVVVKIGSRVLVDQDNHLDEARVEGLVEQLAALHAAGRQVVCVSSGAVAAGLTHMGLSGRPTDLPSLQAAAAIGQARLIELYRTLLGRRGITAGQVLLTHSDLRARDRHLNARNTFRRLLDSGALPIVNENDTVAVDEIRFGDNDVLSALVAMLLRADALVLLSNVEGLMSRAPRGDGPGSGGPGPGRLIDTVRRITPEIRGLAGGAGSAVAVGGMQSKLEAAGMVTRAGEVCVVADGRRPAVLADIMTGRPVGTIFLPAAGRMAARKRWIAFFDHPRGDVTVDEGAARALRERGRSLLAIGVTGVCGSFDRGAPVRVVDPGGVEVARGLVNYDAGEIERIAGLRSEQLAEALGSREYDEVIHRDNLVLR